MLPFHIIRSIAKTDAKYNHLHTAAQRKIAALRLAQLHGKSFCRAV